MIHGLAFEAPTATLDANAARLGLAECADCACAPPSVVPQPVAMQDVGQCVLGAAGPVAELGLRAFFVGDDAGNPIEFLEALSSW